MKIGILVIIFFASLVIRFLHLENKKKSDAIKKKMQVRIKTSKKIQTIKESSDNKHKVSKLLITMLEEFHLHNDVQASLTKIELSKIEKQLKLILPLSYKLFLKFFGDGGSWIYSNSIDSIRNPSWLSDYRNELGEKIELNGEKEIKVDTLLCLMTEDSNGGAWCWLTSEETKDGEWPLAYYSLNDKNLHYKVESFDEWLKILVDSKGEVIRELDLDNKLGLG